MVASAQGQGTTLEETGQGSLRSCLPTKGCFKGPKNKPDKAETEAWLRRAWEPSLPVGAQPGGATGFPFSWSTVA